MNVDIYSFIAVLAFFAIIFGLMGVGIKRGLEKMYLEDIKREEIQDESKRLRETPHVVVFKDGTFGVRREQNNTWTFLQEDFSGRTFVWWASAVDKESTHYKTAVEAYDALSRYNEFTAKSLDIGELVSAL